MVRIHPTAHCWGGIFSGVGRHLGEGLREGSAVNDGRKKIRQLHKSTSIQLEHENWLEQQHTMYVAACMKNSKTLSQKFSPPSEVNTKLKKKHKKPIQFVIWTAYVQVRHLVTQIGHRRKTDHRNKYVNTYIQKVPPPFLAP